MTDAVERREVLYEGHVQGVGFRFTTARIAQRYDVGGYVKNLADGRVEVVAEGRPEEIDKFLGALADAMQGHIRRSTQVTLTPAGEFGDFQIRH